MGSILIHILTLTLILKSINTELYADEAEFTSESEHRATNEHYTNQHEHNKRNKNKHKNQNEVSGHLYTTRKTFKNVLNEHAVVTGNEVFPYMVTILKGAQFLSSGALVDESWVLTTADGLFLLVDSVRFLRVRLGSINYKKGGVLMPVKLIEIHPYYDEKRPNFDLALIMLAQPVRYTPTIKAIRIQMTPREVTATHFIVTSWPGPLDTKSKKLNYLKPIELIKHHRIMTVTHLHPTDPEDCAEELEEIGAPKEAVMCLNPAVENPCTRDVGAPVVLNHILWAVVSSWRPDDCEENSGGPIFATLVSAKNVSQWIHGTIHGHQWKQS